VCVCMYVCRVCVYVYVAFVCIADVFWGPDLEGTHQERPHSESEVSELHERSAVLPA
jgi:hypothetical protein